MNKEDEETLETGVSAVEEEPNSQKNLNLLEDLVEKPDLDPKPQKVPDLKEKVDHLEI